jgi:hypothetical protein
MADTNRSKPLIRLAHQNHCCAERRSTWFLGHASISEAGTVRAALPPSGLVPCRITDWTVEVSICDAFPHDAAALGPALSHCIEDFYRQEESIGAASFSPPLPPSL